MHPNLVFESEGISRKQRIQSALIWISWGTYLVVLISGLYWKDWGLIGVTLASCLLLVLPYGLLKRGHLLASGLLLIFIALGNVTWMATIGQGIHDVSIMAYPIIIIFASLAMNRWGFRLAVLLTLVSMGWLVFGESAGLFVSESFETPNGVDYLVISAILLCAAVAVNLLASDMRKNLDRAQQEIAQRKQAEEALKSSVSLLDASLESTADGILVVNSEGIFTKWNQKFAEMWKLPEEILSSKDDTYVITQILAQLCHPEQFLDKVKGFYTHPHESSFDQIEFLDGRIFERYSQPQKIDQDIVGRVWSFRDVSERKQAEDHLRYQGTHDILTGIYNRNYFEEELTRNERGREYPMSIVIADIDDLKKVNDTLGHAQGDELIRQTANLLSSVFRAGDVLARIGGDEFAALLPGTDPAALEQIVARIQERRADYNSTHASLPVHFSIGAATAKKDNLSGVFTLADQRMYADKAARKTGSKPIPPQ